MYQSGNILYLVFVDHLAFNPANVFWGTLADCRQAAKQIVADHHIELTDEKGAVITDTKAGKPQNIRIGGQSDNPQYRLGQVSKGAIPRIDNARTDSLGQTGDRQGTDIGQEQGKTGSKSGVGGTETENVNEGRRVGKLTSQRSGESTQDIFKGKDKVGRETVRINPTNGERTTVNENFATGHKTTDITHPDGTGSFTDLNTKTNKVEYTYTMRHGPNSENIATKTWTDRQNTSVSDNKGNPVLERTDYPGGKYDLTTYKSDGSRETTNFIDNSNYIRKVLDGDGKTVSGHIQAQDPKTGDIKTTSLGKDDLITGEITQHKEADGKVTASGWRLDSEGNKKPLERSGEPAPAINPQAASPEREEIAIGTGKEIRTHRPNGYDGVVFDNAGKKIGEHHFTDENGVKTKVIQDYASGRTATDIDRSDGTYHYTEVEADGKVLFDQELKDTPNGRVFTRMFDLPGAEKHTETINYDKNIPGNRNYEIDEFPNGRYESTEIDRPRNIGITTDYKDPNNYSVKNWNYQTGDIISGDLRHRDPNTGNITQESLGEKGTITGRMVQSGTSGEVTEWWTTDKDGKRIDHLDSSH